jgi:hypothetical protein
MIAAAYRSPDMNDHPDSYRCDPETMSQSNGHRLPVLDLTCIPDPNAFRTLAFQVDQPLTAARGSAGSVLEHRYVEVGLRRSGLDWAVSFLLCLFLLILLLCRLASVSSHARAQKQCLADSMNRRDHLARASMHQIGFERVLFVLVSISMTTICVRKRAKCMIRALMLAVAEVGAGLELCASWGS